MDLTRLAPCPLEDGLKTLWFSIRSQSFLALKLSQYWCRSVKNSQDGRVSHSSWLTFITHLFLHQTVFDTRRGAGTEDSSDMSYSCVMMQSEFEDDELGASAQGWTPVARGLVPYDIHSCPSIMTISVFHNMSCSGFPASLASCSFNYTVLFDLSSSEKDNMTAILGTPTQKFWPTTQLPFWLRPLKWFQPITKLPF